SGQRSNTRRRSYQRLLFGRDALAGPKTYLATHQSDKQQAKHEVQADESDERKHRIAAADDLAMAVRCAEETINQPRLASQFGRHPAQRVREVRKWKRKYEHPQ